MIVISVGSDQKAKASVSAQQDVQDSFDTKSDLVKRLKKMLHGTPYQAAFTAIFVVTIVLFRVFIEAMVKRNIDVHDDSLAPNEYRPLVEVLLFINEVFGIGVGLMLVSTTRVYQGAMRTSTAFVL